LRGLIVGFGAGRPPGQVLVFAQVAVFQCLSFVDVNPDNFSFAVDRCTPRL
jgi:hypothetical protein